MSVSEKSPSAERSNGSDAAEHVKDGGFILASRVVAQGSQFAIFLVAVQFLTQAEFGFYALATAICSLLIIVSKTGWANFILAGQVRAENVGFIYSIAMLWASILTFVGVGIGLTTTAFMTVPTLGYVIALLSLVLIPTTFSSVNEATMFRRGQVRIAATIHIVSELTGLVIGVATLFMGWKEYGLVAARASTAVFAAICNIFLLKAVPNFRGTKVIFLHAVRFYKDLLAAVLLTFFGNYSGLFIVGFMFGGAAAGVYRAASRFSGAISEFVVEPSNALAWKNVPLSDEELEAGVDAQSQVGARYLSFMRVFALIVSPVMLGIAAVGPELALLLLGQDWAAVGPIFSLLIISSMFAITFYSSGVVFAALDQSSKILKLQFISLVAVLSSLLSLGWFSPLVAAAMHIPPFIFMVWLSTREAGKTLNLPQSDILGALYRPFFCAVAMAGMVTAVRYLLIDSGAGTTGVLVGAIATGVLVYVSLAFIFCRELLQMTLKGSVGMVGNRQNSPS